MLRPRWGHASISHEQVKLLSEIGNDFELANPLRGTGIASSHSRQHLKICPYVAEISLDRRFFIVASFLALCP